MTATLPAGTLCTVSDHVGSDQGDTGPASADDDGPVSLRAGVLVLWIDAAALGVLTLFEVFKLVTDPPRDPGVAAILALLVGVAAFVLVQLGRQLVNRRAWARSPAIVLQLMALPVAFFMLTGEGGPGTKIAGGLIAVVALLGAGLLLAPASRQALTLR
jgi:hypothetical protein